MKVFGVTGWKNSGKTGLVTRLVTHFTQGGLKVSTVKHAHHSFDVDSPGRDSYRHREAGASQVYIASKERLALMRELRGADEPSLEEILAQMSPVDLVLVEGYKREAHAKVEVRRRAATGPLLAANDPSIACVASDHAIAGLAVPLFDLDDTGAIADFIVRRCGLT